jgi:hypothetical protein
VAWRSRELKGFDDFGGGFAFERYAEVVEGGVIWWFLGFL